MIRLMHAFYNILVVSIGCPSIYVLCTAESGIQRQRQHSHVVSSVGTLFAVIQVALEPLIITGQLRLCYLLMRV